MTRTLAEFFPVVVAFFVGVAIITALSLKTKVSAGSTHAGSILRKDPAVAGLRSSAWDLQSIDTALATYPHTVLELVQQQAARADLPISQPADPRYQLATIVEQLERHLDLPPLPDAAAPTSPPLPPASVTPPPESQQQEPTT